MEEWAAQGADGEVDVFAAAQFGDDDELEPIPEDHGEEAWRLAQLGTVRQVADMLQVHWKTVERWRRRNGLPFVRFQGTIRYERDAVLRWAGVAVVPGGAGHGVRSATGDADQVGREQ